MLLKLRSPRQPMHRHVRAVLRQCLERRTRLGLSTSSTSYMPLPALFSFGTSSAGCGYLFSSFVPAFFTRAPKSGQHHPLLEPSDLAAENDPPVSQNIESLGTRQSRRCSSATRSLDSQIAFRILSSAYPADRSLRLPRAVPPRTPSHALENISSAKNSPLIVGLALLPGVRALHGLTFHIVQLIVLKSVLDNLFSELRESASPSFCTPTPSPVVSEESGGTCFCGHQGCARVPPFMVEGETGAFALYLQLLGRAATATFVDSARARSLSVRPCFLVVPRKPQINL